MDRLSLLVRAKISIHASAKEATSLHMLIHLSYLDFNPRLREGGDALRNSITHQTDLISIHASAKEATKSTTATTAAKKISIHASAKEATVYNGTIDWKKVKFQSTPPRRRRPRFIC